MIRALIVDDEDFGRSVLSNLIKKYCPEITIVGEAASAKEAMELINKLSLDLLFLDIEMPGGSGFDLLEKLKKEKEVTGIYVSGHPLAAYR